MTCSIKLLIPCFPSVKNVFFEGFVKFSDHNEITVYITKYFTNADEFKGTCRPNSKDIIHGYYGTDIPIKRFKQLNSYFILNENDVVPQLNKLCIYQKEINVIDNCIIMLYDLNSIKESQLNCKLDPYFTQLHKFMLEKKSELTENFIEQPLTQRHPWLVSSMFFQYIFSYLNILSWLFVTMKKERKVQIKQGNLILSILIDIILGYTLLQLFSRDKKEISTFIMGVLEKLINSLYILLKWCMGAPVGLKLNNAFNKMLGKYFSYHVQLWWLFLDVSSEKLDIILHIYSYLGYLGITLQVAVISDLISIATFHSYCIYVYAARLFNMQISGLIALLRLFVGRKYNPLRSGIDSCEYNNQELFVGTVAFTILLLLLPTTTLYYIVFTMFRIVSLVAQYALAKLIYTIQTLPLYVVTLWLTHSPKVSGNILMEVVRDDKHSPLVLRIKCYRKSIQELVALFKPPVIEPNTIQWTKLISNVLRGKQIV